MAEVREQSQKARKATSKHKNLHEALAAAQVEIVDTQADMKNSHFRSKYVSLGALLTSVRPVLAKHGVSMYTTIKPAYLEHLEEEQVSVNGKTSTIVRNKRERDGHYITGVLSFGNESVESEVHCPKQAGAHQFASFYTYSRRWLLQGLCGVSVDMDDDGNLASGVDSKASGNDRLSHVTNR